MFINMIHCHEVHVICLTGTKVRCLYNAKGIFSLAISDQRITIIAINCIFHYSQKQ